MNQEARLIAECVVGPNLELVEVLGGRCLEVAEGTCVGSVVCGRISLSPCPSPFLFHSHTHTLSLALSNHTESTWLGGARGLGRQMPGGRGTPCAGAPAPNGTVLNSRTTA